MDDKLDRQIAAEKRKIELITKKIEQVKQKIQDLKQESIDLSVWAAQARAKNRSLAPGLDGLIFGSKYRAVARMEMASGNARIAREVAVRRAQIAKGQRSAQEKLRELKSELSASRNLLKILVAKSKEKSSARK